jgi:hypothetical protein
MLQPLLFCVMHIQVDLFVDFGTQQFCCSTFMCWKVRSMHHDACTHVRVLGHQNNMRDNKGDNPAGPADCC